MDHSGRSAEEPEDGLGNKAALFLLMVAAGAIAGAVLNPGHSALGALLGFVVGLGLALVWTTTD